MLHRILNDLPFEEAGRSLRKVLFVCNHNSARSQMAAAMLNAACPQRFRAESAGLEPGNLSPLAVASMAAIGLDISQNATQNVFELFKEGRLYSFVITVCDEAASEKCPVFPGLVERLHWSIPDPAALEGTWDYRLARTHDIRDAISKRVEDFCVAQCSTAGTDPNAVPA